MTNSSQTATVSHSATGFGWCACGSHFDSFWSLGEHLVANGTQFGAPVVVAAAVKFESNEDYAAGLVAGRA